MGINSRISNSMEIRTFLSWRLSENILVASTIVIKYTVMKYQVMLMSQRTENSKIFSKQTPLGRYLTLLCISMYVNCQECKYSISIILCSEIWSLYQTYLCICTIIRWCCHLLLETGRHQCVALMLPRTLCSEVADYARLLTLLSCVFEGRKNGML